MSINCLFALFKLPVELKNRASVFSVASKVARVAKQGLNGIGAEFVSRFWFSIQWNLVC